MRSIPEELTTLISDLESFLSDGLKGENLSKKVKEKRETFIKRIRDVKSSFQHDFKDKSGGESDGEDEADSITDGGSLQSERTDKDEETSESYHQSPPVAAQDLPSVLKAGYLEKRRKDPSFFGTEWQKRWCALSQNTFYYYGHEKDKQQKGEFPIDGYNVKLNNSLRRDAKKDSCFEVSAPDKRVYQFCASSVRDAEDWVKHIDFVLKDMSGMIPEDDDEGHDLYDDTDVPDLQPVDDDIYEELPEEDPPTVAKPPPAVPPARPPVADKSTDYPNYYQGLWDCVGDQSDELSFKRGDTIYILSKEYNKFGWWVGEKNGNVGIVPKDFLMEMYVL